MSVIPNDFEKHYQTDTRFDVYIGRRAGGWMFELDFFGRYRFHEIVQHPPLCKSSAVDEAIRVALEIVDPKNSDVHRFPVSFGQ